MTKKDKLHKQNLKSRKKRDSEEYGGESPVGGYYEVDTEFVLLAYDELDLRNQLAIEFSIENTPLADTEMTFENQFKGLFPAVSQHAFG